MGFVHVLKAEYFTPLFLYRENHGFEKNLRCAGSKNKNEYKMEAVKYKSGVKKEGLYMGKENIHSLWHTKWNDTDRKKV